MAYNPFNAASGIVENKRKWANAKAKGEDTTPYEEGAAVYYKELRDNGRGDVADYLQKSDSITAGEYLKQLQPEYGVDAASLQKKSDNLYGVGVGTMEDISKTFDKVYDNNINVDPTSTGYGKNILSGYGIAADEAYKGTLGGNAEDNGGNVDSFAAANANRQKAAVLSQGYEDVLGYYNTIAGHANLHAVNKGNTVGAYLAQLQGNVDSDRDVTKKAFEGTVDLWKTQDTNKTNKEIADTEAEAQRYVSDNDVKVAEISAKYGVDAAKITAEAEKYGWDTQRIMNSDTLTSNEKIAAAELSAEMSKAASKGGASESEVYIVDSNGDVGVGDYFDVLMGNEVSTPGDNGVKTVDVGNGVEAGGVKSSVLRRLDNAKNNDDRVILINSMLVNGTIEDEQAEWLLDRYGIVL
jgi:hypothetical protein